MQISYPDLGVYPNTGQKRVRCPACDARSKTLGVDTERGLFNCFRCGLSGRIGDDTGDHSEALERARKADQERAIARDKAAQQAQQIWSQSAPAMWHRYLKRKAVLPLGIRQHNDTLVVPMFDADGKLWNCQTINNSGKKLFQRGGRTTGCYYPIQGTSAELYIAEGFATGAALHLYFRQHARVAVAFNCGNLLNVALALREKHPNQPMVIAADNDQWTTGNPGLTHAKHAAETVGAKVIWPTFDGLDTSGKPTDFCDLHLLRRASR